MWAVVARASDGICLWLELPPAALRGLAGFSPVCVHAFGGQDKRVIGQVWMLSFAWGFFDQMPVDS